MLDSLIMTCINNFDVTQILLLSLVFFLGIVIGIEIGVWLGGRK